MNSEPFNRCTWLTGKKMAFRAVSRVQLVGGLGYLSALVACSEQLVRARHTRTIPTGNRRGTVRRPTRDLVKGHLAGMAVVEADDHHAEVQKIGDYREQRRFLPTMLCGA